MEPYRLRSGETWGEKAPAGPSPLPPIEESTGKHLLRRARLAKRVPGWRQMTKEQKDFAIRMAAIDERNERGWRG